MFDFVLKMLDFRATRCAARGGRTARLPGSVRLRIVGKLGGCGKAAAAAAAAATVVRAQHTHTHTHTHTHRDHICRGYR